MQLGSFYLVHCAYSNVWYSNLAEAPRTYVPGLCAWVVVSDRFAAVDDEDC